jgi:hypothetical protein
MAFSNISNLNLGDFLQIAFSDGIRNQISEDYSDWEMIQQVRQGDPNGRQLNFLFQSSLGASAVQYRNPNFSAAFPTAQQIKSSEHTAVYKELDVTVELEYNLWHRAMKSPAKYAEPLAIEMQSKNVAAKRRLAADVYGDGTGVVGRVASVVDDTALDQVVVTLNTDSAFSGFVGMAEYEDLLVAHEASGTAATAPTVTGGTFFAWKVTDKDRLADTVTLKPVDSSGTELALTASNLASTDYFYRVGQPSIPDRTSIADYGTASEVMAGLESLASKDGRVIHGITMSGANAATVKDGGNVQFDISMIQSVMDLAKVRAGRGAYRWKKLVSAPEAIAVVIDSRETDRRFNSVQDATRGINKFVYQHENDAIEFTSSEFCPKKRAYILPENKSSKGKVLEFHSTDFEAVKMGGMGEFHLKPASTGGHERKIVTYMEALQVLICKHPAAIARIENFTV